MVEGFPGQRPRRRSGLRPLSLPRRPMHPICQTPSAKVWAAQGSEIGEPCALNQPPSSPTHLATNLQAPKPKTPNPKPQTLNPIPENLNAGLLDEPKPVTACIGCSTRLRARRRKRRRRKRRPARCARRLSWGMEFGVRGLQGLRFGA